MSHSYRPFHANGTAPTTGEKINPRKLVRRVLIRNLEAPGGNDLGVSFNGGRTYFTIPPQGVLEESVLAHYLFVRGEGGTADYTALLLG